MAKKAVSTKAKTPRTPKKATGQAGGGSGNVIARAYTSPTLVLLAMDWPGGKDRADFLGFAIKRAPGFHQGELDGWLLNKIGFVPPTTNSQPLPSNIAPFQKFLWWDGAINDADRGKTFAYTITPVCGASPTALDLIHADEVRIEVSVPQIERDDISTWFNRAVVSSQAFSREFPDPQADRDRCMQWLSNGLGDAFADILKDASSIAGAIYHLTDNHWVLPALKGFKGNLSLVYEDRKNDQTSITAIDILKDKLPTTRFDGFGRGKTNIMHHKFLVDTKGDRVLMGSTNFTPEAITTQANLLHIIRSKQLAALYAARQTLLQSDPTKAKTAQGASWSAPIAVGKAKIRVFFSPEPETTRVSIDTVVNAVKGAKSSVVFCMFDPTDPALIKALLATSDRKKLLYGLLNSISDPSKSKKAQDLSDSGEAPVKPSAATEIKVTLFNRSREDKKVLAYNYFRKGSAPAGFLPELSAVDFSSESVYKPAKPAKGKKPSTPPAVHIHHKFIVIDGDTKAPTIFTGSANLSNNSTHENDENMLEITECPELAQTYLAEFMRLYEHYRARALWNIAHPEKPSGGRTKATAKTDKKVAQTFTLKLTRDEWVRDAYKNGSLDALARTTLSK